MTRRQQNEEDDDDDLYKDWTPDKPIPDEEGEKAARARVILDRRVEHLKEEAKKKKKSKGLFG
jgi:hypothetical protein